VNRLISYECDGSAFRAVAKSRDLYCFSILTRSHICLIQVYIYCCCFVLNEPLDRSLSHPANLELVDRQNRSELRNGLKTACYRGANLFDLRVECSALSAPRRARWSWAPCRHRRTNGTVSSTIYSIHPPQHLDRSLSVTPSSKGQFLLRSIIIIIVDETTRCVAQLLQGLVGLANRLDVLSNHIIFCLGDFVACIEAFTDFPLVLLLDSFSIEQCHTSTTTYCQTFHRRPPITRHTCRPCLS
jgi:hypothetical protein